MLSSTSVAFWSSRSSSLLVWWCWTPCAVWKIRMALCLWCRILAAEMGCLFFHVPKWFGNPPALGESNFGTTCFGVFGWFHGFSQRGHPLGESKFGMIRLDFFGGHVKQVQGIQAFCALTQVGLGDWDLDLVVNRYAPNGSGYRDMKGRWSIHFTWSIIIWIVIFTGKVMQYTWESDQHQHYFCDVSNPRSCSENDMIHVHSEFHLLRFVSELPELDKHFIPTFPWLTSAQNMLFLARLRNSAIWWPPIFLQWTHHFRMTPPYFPFPVEALVGWIPHFVVSQNRGPPNSMVHFTGESSFSLFKIFKDLLSSSVFSIFRCIDLGSKTDPKYPTSCHGDMARCGRARWAYGPRYPGIPGDFGISRGDPDMGTWDELVIQGCWGWGSGGLQVAIEIGKCAVMLPSGELT